MQEAVISGQKRLMTGQQFSKAVCVQGGVVNDDRLRRSSHTSVGRIQKLASLFRTRQVVMVMSFDLQWSRMTSSEQGG